MLRAAEVSGAVGAGEPCGAAAAAPPPATCAGVDATVVAGAAGGVCGSAACGTTVDGATDALLESIGDGRACIADVHAFGRLVSRPRDEAAEHHQHDQPRAAAHDRAPPMRRAPDAGLHPRERFGCRRHVSGSSLEELRDEYVVFDHQSAPTNVGRSRSRP